MAAPLRTVTRSRGIQETIGNVAFTHGATQAFIVGAFMIWAGSVLVWLFMNVRHEEINDTEAPAGVHGLSRPLRTSTKGGSPIRGAALALCCWCSELSYRPTIRSAGGVRPGLARK